MNLRRHILLYVLLVLVVLNAFVWFSILQKDAGLLTIAFLNVGQGDAIFIEGPTGNQILIDGGNGTQVLRELSRVMPFYDRSIDLIIATHPDQDHTGGLIDVVNRFTIGAFMEPGVNSGTSVYNELLSGINANNITRVTARRGQRVVLGGGAFLEILFPDRDTTGWDTNDASIIARLVFGDTSFMLMGDAPKKMEEYLVSLDGDRLQSDVLKLGHHGSKTSTSVALLSSVMPEYAVVSAGKDNRYGHPHREVVERVIEFGALLLSTSDKGTIIVESDGRRLFLQ